MNILFYNFRLVNAQFTTAQESSGMLVKNGRIVWIGLLADLPPQSKLGGKLTKKINLKDQLVFPSFIECHTHSIFAGSRAEEFELRNTGTSYLQIAARGGGILSTVKCTRAASKAELQNVAQSRINEFVRQGVSTVEIKSGYGLDLESEMKILEVARALKTAHVIPTFLGAHAKPENFTNHQGYLDYLVQKVLPVLKKKKLSRRVDIFTEKNFFEVAQSEIYLKEFIKAGFEVTMHANQLSDSEATDLAIALGARSADHVIQLSEKTITRLARSNTVAVLLPLADLYMKCDYPPARKLIDRGARVALATDFNPGTSPSQDIMLVGLLARLKMQMTLAEVFVAYTINAACALGIQKLEGSLEVGKKANFICTSSALTDFFYSAGTVPPHQLFIGGNKIKRRQIK